MARCALRGRWVVLGGLCSSLVSGVADAKPPAPARAEGHLPATAVADARLVRARDLYKQGLAAVQDAQWAEALRAFEESLAIRPHSLTLYNIGACERALGRYAKAQATLERALELSRSEGNQLPPSVVTEATGYIDEIRRLLAHVSLTIEPKDATLTVDGRPLEQRGDSVKLTLVAGRRDPGLGEPLPASNVDVELDPGAHVFTVARKGFAARVLNNSFTPGSHQSLVLNLDKLPGSLKIASDQEGSVVRVNSLDVGTAPVEVTRPAGDYRVDVLKRGFVTYETSVALGAGEESDIRASLKREQTNLLKEWWFWTAASVVITGAAIGTYYATRPAPEPVRPPLDGGGLSWTVQAPQ